MSEDCFLFIDPQSQTIRSLHVTCRNEHYPDTGWFYNGSKEGYGPWDFICSHCGKLIHKAENEEIIPETSD